MPVTKTAKRALRGSKRKGEINKKTSSNLDIAIRQAKRDKSDKKVKAAIALADRAAKKKLIHKNKAARIKSMLSKLVKLVKNESKSTKKTSSKKSTKAKK